jgi:hypothetical protein
VFAGFTGKRFHRFLRHSLDLFLVLLFAFLACWFWFCCLLVAAWLLTDPLPVFLQRNENETKSRVSKTGLENASHSFCHVNWPRTNTRFEFLNEY